MPPTSTRSNQLRNTQPNFCQTLHLTEENIRFVLLAILLYVYLCIGAFIFQAVEEPKEEEMRKNYEMVYNKFHIKLAYLNQALKPLNSEELQKENNIEDLENSYDSKEQFSSTYSDPYISEDDLLNLLYTYGNATKGGAFSRKRWDWVGSFHFAWTIVSTIGYGATTPSTTAGQLLIIPYGFLGCSGGLLFFNLFLERIITFLASCMRCYRTRRLNQRSSIYRGSVRRVWTSQNGRRSSQSSVENTGVERDWKPSVYWVMLFLVLISTTVIVGSAGLFHSLEGWTFTESLYFSFVSYATIGFGDYVALQQVSYGTGEIGYRIGAFAILILGCCCIYSLLNVTSIVIKQSLNWMIRRSSSLFCNCFQYFPTSMNRRLSEYRTRVNRRANLEVNGEDLNSERKTRVSVIRLHTSQVGQAQHTSFEMDERERRCSAENMVSIHNEHNSRVSFAVMQKRLYETAQMSKSGGHEHDFSTRSIGPLAIVTERLNDTSQNNE